jgi:hypothetical protein
MHIYYVIYIFLWLRCIEIYNLYTWFMKKDNILIFLLIKEIFVFNY